jgi:hypothetical protein
MNSLRSDSISRLSLHYANIFNAFYLRPLNTSQIRTFHYAEFSNTNYLRSVKYEPNKDNQLGTIYYAEFI